MDTLFDVTPTEPTAAKKPRRKVVPPQAEVQEPEKKPYLYKGNQPVRAIKALGTLDEGHECADSTCRGTAHDILHEEHGEWLIQCCFCNTAQWVPVVKGHLEPKEDEFVFRDGRFSGLSIDEAVALPRGLEYVVWAAKEHKRPAVKAACETWLAKNRSER
jgi:hypothetical protein